MKQQGVVFADRKNGRPSTTQAGKAILSAALARVDPALAAQVATERDWRRQYRQYFERITAAAVRSADNAQAIARDGLAAVPEHFEFERDGRTWTLHEAMASRAARLHTVSVRGRGRPVRFGVPWRGRRLTAASLQAQMADWQRRGIVEASHAQAVLSASDRPEWIEQMPAVALLGAAAQMGPLTTLLELGATVVAIDVDRPAIWQRLIAQARASAGTLILPVREPPTSESDEALAALAGTDLLTCAPEIAAWLVALERPLAIGACAYLDGGDFVRVSVAMDAIMQAVSERSAQRVDLAFLLTPTDAYAIPEAVMDAANARYEQAPWWQPVLRALSARRWFARGVRDTVHSAEGHRYGIVNHLVVQQGPNYTLAKRLQRWRAVVARAHGQVVSCNVAPATHTHSVTKNALFAAGYAGSEAFGAETFEPAASNALMAGQLMHDLMHESAASRPHTPLANPEELFMDGANHSGFWRMPCQLGSLLEPAVVVGTLKRWTGR